MSEETDFDVIIKHLKEKFEGVEYPVIHNEIVPFITRVRNEILLPHASKSEKYHYARWDDLENTIILHKASMQALEQIEAIKKAMETSEDKALKTYVEGLNVVAKSLKRRLNETV